jgi:hypothetical protein
LIDFYGTPVYLDPQMVERVQIRFPKTKKKRIRRKWAKRPCNWVERPLRDVYQVGGAFIMHPALWREFCQTLDVEVAAGLDGLLRAAARGIGEHLMRRRERQALLELVPAATSSFTLDQLTTLVNSVKSSRPPMREAFVVPQMYVPDFDRRFLITGCF